MRWPLEPLAALIGGRPGAMALGFDSGEWSRAQRSGLGDIAADRWATRCGLHPFTVWPEMADAAIESVARPCADPKCSVRFVPANRTGQRQRYCSTRCKHRHSSEVRRATPAGRAANAERRRRYYAENADYERARERRRYRAARAS